MLRAGDERGLEAGFLKDALERRGCGSVVVDAYFIQHPRNRLHEIGTQSDRSQEPILYADDAAFRFLFRLRATPQRHVSGKRRGQKFTADPAKNFRSTGRSKTRIRKHESAPESAPHLPLEREISEHTLDLAQQIGLGSI